MSNKTQRITIRVTEEERKMLEQEAGFMTMTLSEYIRFVLNEKEEITYS